MTYEIEILIDLLTQCLVDRKSGVLVDTSIHRVHPRHGENKGWNFNWAILENDKYEVYALYVAENVTMQGLIAIRSDSVNHAVECGLLESNPQNIGHEGKYGGVGAHLMAFACKTAAERGFNACHFVSKTDLIEHYSKTLGAVQIGHSQKMIIAGAAFKELIERYYGNKGDA